ncbi:MAG: serine hydrolase domain-containing protein [Acidimicrobiales bacterium]
MGERAGRAFLVVLDGQILAERTWGSPDPYRRDVASAQKSTVSVLGALAHADGTLDRDAPAGRYLGSGWSFASPVEEAEVTVGHLLTMTSGLGPDLWRVATPGSVWDYNNNAYQLLRLVLEEATGTDIQYFTRSRLWDPIGVSADSTWAPRPGQGANSVDPKGRRLWGLTMTVRDMARFGLLVQWEGRWGDATVIPAGALERASVRPRP